MIRNVGRALAAVTLELATLCIVVAVVLLGLSAYLTARVIGVNKRFNRTEAAMTVVRDAMALAVDAKRRMSAPSEAPPPS